MRVYFIGIGGIGVSALAKYYLDKGHKVFGSDLVSSGITDDLKKRGAKIAVGRQKSENIKAGFNLVIFSPAVKQDNPELREARQKGIKCQSYPEALGELTKNNFTIAVTGTHGKSTTTCMLGLILQKAGLDPTVIVGTKLKEFGNSNYRGGKSKYLIVEACEHFESFLNYWPKIIVLTNIEEDHLDYYKNLNNIKRGFKKFISHLPQDGFLIINGDDKNAFVLAKSFKYKTKFYSLGQPENKKIKEVLKVPGSHNISNALAAFEAAKTLGVSNRMIFSALSEFRGSWRRFEEKIVKINKKNHKLIFDYGHHPTEIKATIEAAREKYPSKKIWCVFQPHQYQRTHFLFNDFVRVFRSAPADKIIITDIYDVAGREEKNIKKLTSSKRLTESIGKSSVFYIKTEEMAWKYLGENLKNGDVIIIMGAGDIYEVFSGLIKKS